MSRFGGTKSFFAFLYMLNTEQTTKGNKAIVPKTALKDFHLIQNHLLCLKINANTKIHPNPSR